MERRLQSDFVEANMLNLQRLTLLILLTPAFLAAHSTMPVVPKTNGFGESTCTSCHLGTALNASGGSVIARIPQFYTPGATYVIDVTVTDTTGGRGRWGFELAARFTDGSQAGSFTIMGTNTSVQMGSNNVQYAGHYSAVRQTGSSYTYQVNWTAPSTANGDIVFNAAGNAANGDGTNGGDHIYAAEFHSSPMGAGPQPAVNGGGVVNAASFQSAISRGQLISIFGTNLSVGGPYSAGSIPLPTQLPFAGDEVKLGATSIPLIYVSAQQINAQIPMDMPDSGPQSLTATLGGRISTIENITLSPTSPAVFTTNQSGQGDGAILQTDFSAVDANHPARAGDTVLIYCSGLGATNPLVPNGAAGNGERVVATIGVTIGGRDALVNFAGAAPGFAGLYQINAVVPSGISGASAEVIVSAGNGRSRSGVTVPLAP
jgi:uncharacterized protein (TIGR03437 family)